MAHDIHPGKPHDWLWLGPDIRHMGDGAFKEICIRVCVICLADSGPSRDHCKIGNIKP